MPAVAADSILERFRATLDTVYGDRIVRVVCSAPAQRRRA